MPHSSVSLASLLLLTYTVAGATVANAQDEVPEVMDQRLQLQLIAEDPDVRTPIGLAVDAQDRLYVLESHTHSRPADYEGPDSDRVLRFADADGDGEYQRSVFATGIRQGMNLAFSPSGILHVACAKQVVRLADRDNDGKCDVNETLITMDTQNGNPHSGLLGITFDRDGTIYLARGNNGSYQYTLKGADGSTVSGYGDGGSILQCAADGSSLRQFATGFWNPIQLKFDRYGRLLCVDNDPDARGPNRIVHIVEGGDYGHRNLFGGGGNHPFQGWNGELPGTLPYAGGTGEAPCDLLDAARARLPAGFENTLLVTVWNEYTIERHLFQPRGTSFHTTSDVIVKGGKQFRPVAIDANSRGEIFFTDWVKVDYPNHGRGRLWRLRMKSSDDLANPARKVVGNRSIRGTFDPPIANDGVSRLTEVSHWEAEKDQARLRSAVAGDDDFTAHVAMLRMAKTSKPKQLREWGNHPDPPVRMAALLAALRRSDPAAPSDQLEDWQIDLLRKSLSDPEPTLRQAALIEAGTRRVTAVASSIDAAIALENTTPTVLDTWMEAKASLEPTFVEGYDRREHESAKKIPRRVRPAWLTAIAADDTRPPRLRGTAASRMMLPLTDPQQTLLRSWLGPQQPPELQQAAIAGMKQEASSIDSIMGLATTASVNLETRLAAIAALSGPVIPEPMRLRVAQQLTDLVKASGMPEIAIQAARSSQTLSQLGVVKQQASRWLADLQSWPANQIEIRESLWRIVGQANPDRPNDLERWKRTLAVGGDPLAGRHVFASAAATCVQCHRIDGFAETLGPNLSGLSQSVDRQQIVHSILRPSDAFAPQYQAWQILTADGNVATGLQIDHLRGGAIEMILSDGTKVHFAANEIEDYRAVESSIMPSGLEQNLTVSQMRDLVAFLDSQ